MSPEQIYAKTLAWRREQIRRRQAFPRAGQVEASPVGVPSPGPFAPGLSVFPAWGGAAGAAGVVVGAISAADEADESNLATGADTWAQDGSSFGGVKYHPPAP